MKVVKKNPATKGSREVDLRSHVDLKPLILATNKSNLTLLG